MIGRASECFGPEVRFSIVGERVFPAALAGRPAAGAGQPDLPHTGTFIDDIAARDFAAGLVTLGRGRRPWVARPQRGHRDHAAVGGELVVAEAGSGLAGLRVAPRLAIAVLASVNPTIPAVRAQGYQTACRLWSVAPAPSHARSKNHHVGRSIRWAVAGHCRGGSSSGGQEGMDAAAARANSSTPARGFRRCTARLATTVAPRAVSRLAMASSVPRGETA